MTAPPGEDRAQAWQAARRVLVVRLDGAGDLLMTTPAIRALKAARPDRHVAVLASPAGAALARLVPEVDEVIEYVAPWMKPPASPDAREHVAMVERLRAGAFDAAVIATVFSQSAHPAALLCTLAGIPLRLAHARERPYHLLTDWVPEPEPEQGIRHEARRQLDLVAAVGALADDERLSLRAPDEARERVRALLEGLLTGDEPWCVLHPGATAPSRRYPVESFAEAGRTLAEEHGWRVLLAAGRDEAALAEVVASAIPGAVDLGGRLGVEEFVALVEEAPLVVCNNSLAAHVAAAAGTPVVDLYALTNPQHTPWKVPHRVLFHDVPCRNCFASVCPEGHHACLRGVATASVVDAALDLADRRPAAEVDTRRALSVTDT